MRYARIDTISFTPASGPTVAIKDIRPMPTYIIKSKINVTEKDRLDEIASRQDVYGEEGYRDAYKLFDANAIRLIEGQLDMGKVRVVEVPT